MDININDPVKVKLTATGHKILNELTYITVLKEDKEGWSEWQLWELMQVFGPHLALGNSVPFENNILRIVRRGMK